MSTEPYKYLGPILAAGWLHHPHLTRWALLLLGQAATPHFHISRQHLTPDRIYHVTVMPCYDKKLEASRPDFFNQEHQTRDVDCVVTTGWVPPP